jgi:uncharacterized membrane protein YcaP (DUF421 family)
MMRRIETARIYETDVMEAAPRPQGLERLDQVKFAVLEVTGGITTPPVNAGPLCSAARARLAAGATAAR